MEIFIVNIPMRTRVHYPNLRSTKAIANNGTQFPFMSMLCKAQVIIWITLEYLCKVHCCDDGLKNFSIRKRVASLAMLFRPKTINTVESFSGDLIQI